MSEKPVLWKTRSQRLAESFILPLVLLPIGPALRALLGDNYGIYYGFLAIFLLLFLATIAGRGWALSHGGEWVSNAERLRRTIAETGPDYRWGNALSRAAMLVLMMLALFVIIDPLDRFGQSLGGPAFTLAFIVTLAIVGAVPALTTRHERLAAITIEEGPAPPRHALSELLKSLPRTYLIYAVSIGAGTMTAWYTAKDYRLIVFVAISLLAMQVVRLLVVKLPKRIFANAAATGFGISLLYGVLCWGVPMGMFFSGFAVLTLGHNPLRIAAGIGIAVLLSLVGGVFFGTWAYVINRLTNRRRQELSA